MFSFLFFDIFDIRKANVESAVGHSMDVWLDPHVGAPPLHTFESNEPVYLKTEPGDRTVGPMWWIERFERGPASEWHVRVRSQRVPTYDTDWKISPVHALVPIPVMLRLALEISA